jgi:ferredoxin
MHTPNPKTTLKSATLTRQACIGCADCAGLCKELLELVFVPDSVLHRSNAVP